MVILSQLEILMWKLMPTRILNEAHVILIHNPKAGISQAVCRLRASRRWIVTGTRTPVQNKELDMSSLLSSCHTVLSVGGKTLITHLFCFLSAKMIIPHQLQVWKRWVDSSKSKNDVQAQGRLQLLIKTLLLRQTKD